MSNNLESILNIGEECINIEDFHSLILNNVPLVQDIYSMNLILKSFGVKSKLQNSKIFFDSKKIINNIADYDLVRKMRASILILGPLLSRFSIVKISLPGGCAIGTRPIDIHLDGLKKLGVRFSIENGFVIGEVKEKLIGSKIDLSFPSVGATENIMMAAVLAQGKTIIHNAAKEPEIIDLAQCLINMGAKIKGAGTKKIEIQGVKYLSKTNHTIIPDRIVAGTYIIAAIMNNNNNFLIKNINPEHLKSPLKILKKMGAKFHIGSNYVKVFPSTDMHGINLETEPYPGFPTDLQAQIMALMSIIKGKSQIKEKIFENRFMHVSELNRLGAKIKVKNETAYIEGAQIFKGAQVMASDLRASGSLVLAGLFADGKTTINRVYHLDRGYEKIEETLRKCGAKIKRISK